jgi:hypothetical protein
MAGRLSGLGRGAGDIHDIQRAIGSVAGGAGVGSRVGAGIGGHYGGKKKPSKKESEKTAARSIVNAPRPRTGTGAGAMEQPAMGTGKGAKPGTRQGVPLINGTGTGLKKKTIKKMAEDAGASVEDVLSEMMAQSQARHDDQPFWADQGSTESMASDDPAYGHGKGLKGKGVKKGKLAPPFTDTFNPTDLPQAFGKKSMAKKAAVAFLGKLGK